MYKQMNNLIKILRAAVVGDMPPLEAPEWESLYRLARIHSVIPLFNEGAAKYPEYEDAPEELKMNAMINSVAMISLQAQQTDRFLETYDALIKAGLRPLVLKGLICRLAYGDLADHRSSGDDDVYIPKADCEKCRQVLQGLGYTAEAPDPSKIDPDTWGTVAFVLPPQKIEVHVRLFDTNTELFCKCGGFFENAFSKAVSVNVGSHTVYTMDPTLHFLYLIIHFYKHIINSGAGIRQILDIVTFYSAHSGEINLPKVEAILPELRADKLYADILAVGELLGFCVPTKLPRTDPDALIEEIAEAGIFGTDNNERVRGNVIVRAEAYKTNNTGLLRRIFPSLSVMSKIYPETGGKLWRYPMVWARRCLRFFSKKDVVSRSKDILVQHADYKFAGSEAVKIADRRIRLLKEYGIIKQ